jgi:hypothetical protein
VPGSRLQIKSNRSGTGLLWSYLIKGNSICAWLTVALEKLLGPWVTMCIGQFFVFWLSWFGYGPKNAHALMLVPSWWHYWEELDHKCNWSIDEFLTEWAIRRWGLAEGSRSPGVFIPYYTHFVYYSFFFFLSFLLSFSFPSFPPSLPSFLPSFASFLLLFSLSLFLPFFVFLISQGCTFWRVYFVPRCFCCNYLLPGCHRWAALFYHVFSAIMFSLSLGLKAMDWNCWNHELNKSFIPWVSHGDGKVTNTLMLWYLRPCWPGGTVSPWEN